MNLTSAEWIYYTIMPVIFIASFTAIILSTPKKKYRSWKVFQQKRQKNSIDKKLAGIQKGNSFLKFLSPIYLEKEAAKYDWKLKGTATLWIYFPPIIGAILGFVLQSPPVILVGIYGGLMLPWFILSDKKRLYKAMLEEQLVNLVESISSSYSVTNNFNTSMEQALDGLQEPLYSKWKALVTKRKSGVKLEGLLKELAEKLDIEAFNVCVTLFVQIDNAGGDASKTLERVANNIAVKQLHNAEAMVESIQGLRSHKMNVIISVVLIIFFRYALYDNFNQFMQMILGQVFMTGMFVYTIWSFYRAKQITDI